MSLHDLENLVEELSEAIKDACRHIPTMTSEVSGRSLRSSDTE